MPQTTKLIRQQLENKKQRREAKTGRLKLWLILIITAGVLVIAPLMLVGGSIGFTLLNSVQSIPNYATAEADFIAQNQPNQARFFARNANGEPIELFNAPEPIVENGRWLSPDEFSTASVNLVYAQWPELFLNANGTNSSPFELFTPDSTISGSPASSISTFINGESFNDTAFGRLQDNLLQNQIQASWEQKELAAWHLNSSYFGNGVFGLQSAARFYFERDASQLTLPEAAMLIGVPQNPAVNPIDDPTGAKLQQEEMLEGLLRNEFITQEQFIAARFTPLDINFASFSNSDDAILERFLNSRLEKIEAPTEIATSGLTVVTTINPELQRELHCLTDFYLNYVNGQGLTGDGECPAALNLASSSLFPTGQFNRADSLMAMVLDPTTGQVLALSGAGEIARKPSGNREQPAGEREAGGMLYPFVYLTALSQGHTLSSMVLDIADDDKDSPAGMGPIFLEEALVSNSPAAAEHVLGWMGLGSTFKTVSEMGADPSATSALGYQPGVSDVNFSFVDIVHAYGVLANSGVRVGIQPFGQTQQSAIISQIENGRGDILYEANSPEERAILPDELTWLINQELASQTLPNGQTVVKKTANGIRNFDEWTIGYSSNLVVAVWAGNLKVEGERLEGEQSITPVLWETIMLDVAEDRPISTWAPPDNIVTLDVCWPSGLQPNGLCPTRQGLFIAGTEPILFDTMYQSFLVNSENGNLATSSTPPNRITPITVQVFPEEAKAWATANGYELPPTAYDSIRTENETSGFKVESPVPFDAVPQQTTINLEFTELEQFDYFRVAAYEGLSPGALQILAENIEPNRNLLNLDILISLPYQQDGLYTLLITGFREDGSIEELAIPVNADVAGPTFRLTRPLENSTISTGEEMLFVQVEVADPNDVERVEYYLNDETRPIVSGTVTPFTGGIPLDNLIEAEVDCFSVRAVAFDQRGNRSEDLATNICFE